MRESRIVLKPISHPRARPKPYWFCRLFNFRLNILNVNRNTWSLKFFAFACVFSVRQTEFSNWIRNSASSLKSHYAQLISIQLVKTPDLKQNKNVKFGILDFEGKFVGKGELQNPSSCACYWLPHNARYICCEQCSTCRNLICCRILTDLITWYLIFIFIGAEQDGLMHTSCVHEVRAWCTK